MLGEGYMTITEDSEYSRDYLDPDSRSIANAVRIVFTSGEATPRVEVRYTLGHRRRRTEAMPDLRDKFASNIATRLLARRVALLLQLWDAPDMLVALPVQRFVDRLAL